MAPVLLLLIIVVIFSQYWYNDTAVLRDKVMKGNNGVKKCLPVRDLLTTVLK